MAEIKPVKIFSRENPCTKVDIHNCFFDGRTYVRRAVVEARGEIGLNTPKYLLKNEYLAATHERGIDYLALTQAGKEWLEDGLRRFLALHPERAADVKHAQGARRAVQAAPAPAKGTQAIMPPAPLRRTRTR
ncbi:MAG: hypothetical protein RSE62_03420 [Citrobacter sp.]